MAGLNQIENCSSDNLEQKMVDDELVIDIEKIIQGAEDDILSRPYCCIYKVPHSIRKINEYIYTPTTIPTGPFHHGNWELKGMERHKAKMLQRFIVRANEKASLSLHNLTSFVRNLEPTVRASYSENTTNLNEKEFQMLMLVDGAFIIELFLSAYHCISSDAPHQVDALLPQPKLLSDIKKDLLLLENQLPFFFLEDLYEQAFAVGDPSFIELSYRFFDSLNTQRLEPNSNVQLNHFTDLLRLFHLPEWLPPRVGLFGETGNDILLYSAKQLEEVDLKFKVKNMEVVCPLDIKISNNLLEIPRILVNNDSVIFFYNMIALEQCHYPDEHYLCDYALLLDCLINSHEDVNVLIRRGIIRNSLGDPVDVVRIFDGLSTNLSLVSFNSDYSKICRELNSQSSCETPTSSFYHCIYTQHAHSCSDHILYPSSYMALGYFEVVQSCNFIISVFYYSPT